VYTLYVALQKGLKLTAYCSETRPYLQGARLTADAIADMGIPTTVVTDNMPGFIISKGLVSVFMSGADRVSMSGHVFNKIGTFQIALAAHHYQVPYYAFSSNPDPEAPNPEDVEIEERNPEEVLHCLGARTATPKAKGFYPAFDITPPEFVSAVITHKGVYSPYDLVNYYNTD
jgi:methylthioribose-1-phosphate isomerase